MTTIAYDSAGNARESIYSYTYSQTTSYNLAYLIVIIIIFVILFLVFVIYKKRKKSDLIQK